VTAEKPTQSLQDVLDSVPNLVDHLYSNRKGSVLKDAVLRQPAPIAWDIPEERERIAGKGVFDDQRILGDALAGVVMLFSDVFSLPAFGPDEMLSRCALRRIVRGGEVDRRRQGPDLPVPRREALRVAGQQ